MKLHLCPHGQTPKFCDICSAVETFRSLENMETSLANASRGNNRESIEIDDEYEDNLDIRKFFVSYHWTRQYCGTYSTDSGYGNCHINIEDDGLTQKVIESWPDLIKTAHIPKGSKLVTEINSGSGVKVDITILNIVEVEG